MPAGASYSDVVRCRVSRLDDRDAIVRGDRDGGTTIARRMPKDPRRCKFPGRRVSANFFRRAWRGARRSGERFEQARIAASTESIVLTDGVWRRLFGADSAIVGRADSVQRRRVHGDRRAEAGLCLSRQPMPQMFTPLDFTAAMSDVNRARKFHFCTRSAGCAAA